MSLKIVYVSNSVVPWTTEQHYARSLRALGHEVVMFQENDAASWPSQDGYPDLLLWTHTHGWSPGDWGLAQLDLLKVAGVPSAMVHLDRWFGLAREGDVLTEPCFAMSDRVFTADGDATAAFKALGIDHHWLRAGVVEDECYLGERDQAQYPYLVAFVGSGGSRYHNVEWPHRNEMIDHLREWYGSSFVHIGHGGEFGSVPHTAPDLNTVFASVPVIVGDSCQVHEGTKYWSDRPYECWGRGGALVFPYVDALTAEIGPYPSWKVGDWDGLHAKVDELLANPMERKKDRDRLHRIVKDRCTYKVRAVELLRMLGLS